MKRTVQIQPVMALFSGEFVETGSLVYDFCNQSLRGSHDAKCIMLVLLDMHLKVNLSIFIERTGATHLLSFIYFWIAVHPVRFSRY